MLETSEILVVIRIQCVQRNCIQNSDNSDTEGTLEPENVSREKTTKGTGEIILS